jgi:hypothetical protein
MKKIFLLTCIMTGFVVCCYAQNRDDSMDPKYNKLIYKDIASVMKALNIKDTTGKTYTVMIPQIEKGAKFLIVKLDNGDKLAFKDNWLKAIIPPHHKK